MRASKKDVRRLRRLPSQTAFDSLRKTRDIRWTSEGMTLQAQAMPEDGAEGYGLCVSASRKTARRAHDRNRMKRRLRAVAAEILPHYARSGTRYMLSARSGTSDRDYELLCKDLLWCLKKLDLMKKTY
jgi:ribonuclease P protein component